MTPLPPAPETTPGTPWERRAQIGFVTALVETTQQALVGPEAFFRAMPVAGGVGGPLLYGVILSYFGIVVSSFYSFLFSFLTSGAGLSRYGELERLAPLLGDGRGLVLNIVMGPLIAVIAIFVVSGLLHLGLLVFGGAQRGFEATLRVVCYSQATAVLQIVPFCGSLVGVVYWIVLAIVGLAAAHATSKGTAAAAVLAPLLLICCCCVLGVLLFVGGIASLAGLAR
jgi:hypothetical protein